jgi:hypothetical protein
MRIIENHPADILFREGHQLVELEKQMRAATQGGGEVCVTEVGPHMRHGNPQPPFFQ